MDNAGTVEKPVENATPPRSPMERLAALEQVVHALTEYTNYVALWAEDIARDTGYMKAPLNLDEWLAAQNGEAPPPARAQSSAPTSRNGLLILPGDPRFVGKTF